MRYDSICGHMSCVGSRRVLHMEVLPMRKSICMSGWACKFRGADASKGLQAWLDLPCHLECHECCMRLEGMSTVPFHCPRHRLKHSRADETLVCNRLPCRRNPNRTRHGKPSFTGHHADASACDVAPPNRNQHHTRTSDWRMHRTSSII